MYALFRVESHRINLRETPYLYIIIPVRAHLFFFFAKATSSRHFNNSWAYAIWSSLLKYTRRVAGGLEGLRCNSFTVLRCVLYRLLTGNAVEFYDGDVAWDVLKYWTSFPALHSVAAKIVTFKTGFHKLLPKESQVWCEWVLKLHSSRNDEF